MFGTNAVVGKKFFSTEEAKGKLKVTSMFFTLQGEGPFANYPALFLRLTHCNLDCSFCDTEFERGDWLTYDEILGRAYHTVWTYFNSRGKDVPQWALPRHATPTGPMFGPWGFVLVVTGGEPLLQENLIEFLHHTKDKFKYTQIESNGTIQRDLPQHVTYVCSPKCIEKNGVAIRYLKPSPWLLERADCLKFVMRYENHDLLEDGQNPDPYSEVPDWALKWHESTGKVVYVSPMNIYNDVPQQIKITRAKAGEVTMAERSTLDETISFWTPGLLNQKENQRNHEYTAAYCLDHGLRFNLQTHLYASLP